jgi:ankyrin repeat protein
MASLGELFKAIKDNDLPKIEELLKPKLFGFLSSLTVNSKGYANDTPLHIAAESGRSSIAEYFIKHGAEIDIMNKNGETPLYLAAANGHTHLVRLLVASGAEINRKSGSGDTPLLVSLEKGYTDMAKALISLGADITMKDGYGYTPLHWAANKGFIDTMNTLIEKNADVNAKIFRGDYEGYTPVMEAAKQGHSEAVSLLIFSGAAINNVDKDGLTELHWASYYGFLDVVNILLEHGADINVKSFRGMTPLQLAAQQSHPSIVRLFVEKGTENLDLAQVYKNITSENPFHRLTSAVILKEIESDKAYYELIQTSALDGRREVRLAAICALALKKDRPKIIAELEKWTFHFGNKCTTGGNPKMTMILALAIIKDYDLDKALDFEFQGKAGLLKEIEETGVEKSEKGVDRIGYLTTFFLALDKGMGDESMVTEIKNSYPELEDLLNAVLKYMKKDLQ